MTGGRPASARPFCGMMARHAAPATPLSGSMTPPGSASSPLSSRFSPPPEHWFSLSHFRRSDVRWPEHDLALLRIAIPLEPMSDTTVLPFAIDRGRHALFLDFDGTLVEIAERPDAVRVEPEARAALAFLAHELAGAVAIVTGREIADIDYHLSPLSLPVAGVHGLTRRSFDGALADVTLSSAFVPVLEQALRPFAERNAGVLVERKRGAVALHYRLRPELEGEAI